ncbi:hypothetical protein PCANC_13366 [Puccinia coronata f. sp. avenae]|uniref:DUF7872 domain-containing protein n=1 Tax=Puccinia coronata f. sp. avenae TaxID=200324 RepID=A0A2N5VTP8_9BASI|nr:hypothetical protein PCANC_23560 [Puccinia coronata f. sp. avenae]PLW10166.1 hypothetical protein PCASD_19885 [Puccinia coronata f. sp. avenae]PLW51072.1 hypothetical protein PCASD_02528 [Puccinia coronata f. sp. avenae]PLW53356.1 hypothetical protein PCANC_13366 [Puccinia coronata f. sp. avenae]
MECTRRAFLTAIGLASLLLLCSPLGVNSGLPAGPPTPNSLNPVLQNPCVLPQRLSPQLWDQIQIDEFVKTYPGIQSISAQEFARQNGADNFHCGIGEKCNIGELCYPVKGLPWYILFAIQEFNLYMNMVHKAVGTTMELVRVTTASLLTDLIEPNEKESKKHHEMTLWFDSFLFLTTITLSLSLGLLVGMSTLAVDSTWFTVGEIAKYVGLSSAASFTGFVVGDMVNRSKEHKPESAFGYWSQFSFYFSECQNKMQQGITDSLRKTLDQGIAQPGTQSLADLLAHGTFLSPRAKKNSPQIEAALKDVTQIRSLVILLRSMNAFVTRGSEPCSGHGVNGAWEEKDHLSFCGPDNVMMNIVLARGDKVESTIHNAQTIALKYSISTEYLTTGAWQCQTKHGMYFDPYERAALPTDPNADCLVNLPVCDCTRQDIQIEIKKSGIVNACRKLGNLKI